MWIEFRPLGWGMGFKAGFWVSRSREGSMQKEKNTKKEQEKNSHV